jgi:hypothetical protein
VDRKGIYKDSTWWGVLKFVERHPPTWLILEQPEGFNHPNALVRKGRDWVFSELARMNYTPIDDFIVDPLRMGSLMDRKREFKLFTRDTVGASLFKPPHMPSEIRSDIRLRECFDVHFPPSCTLHPGQGKDGGFTKTYLAVNAFYDDKKNLHKPCQVRRSMIALARSTRRTRTKINTVLGSDGSGTLYWNRKYAPGEAVLRTMTFSKLQAASWARAARLSNVSPRELANFAGDGLIPACLSEILRSIIKANWHSKRGHVFLSEKAKAKARAKAAECARIIASVSKRDARAHTREGSK